MLGYAFGDHLDAVLPLLHRGGYALAGAAVAIVIVAVVVWRLRVRKTRPSEG